MKAYELMAKAKENPDFYSGKKYKVIKGKVYDGNGNISNLVHVCGSGQLGCNGYYVAYISSDVEVEEIPKEVPFLEAVKAYLEGKTIRCEIEEKTYKYTPTDKNMCLGKIHEYQFREMSHWLTAGQILNGVWYVED